MNTVNTFHPVPTLLDQRTFQETYQPGNLDVKGYTKRRQYIEMAGWFILVKEQAEILAKFLKGKRVIEVAAGNGYLAAHLRQLGVENYRAFDAFSKNYPSTGINYGAVKRDVHSVNIASADVIVLTWPNYLSNLAEVVAKRMRKDQVLIYQGEGSYGCTANDKFHDYIYNPDKFVELSLLSRKLNHYQLNWEGMHDSFTVVRKLTNR